MKKVLLGLLISVLSLSFLVAQEEEEDSMFSPSASIENELTIPGKKSGEDERKGNVHANFEEFENSTKAKFGVGIALMEGFTLKPYVSDQVVVGFGAAFKKNDFTIGLSGKYAPIEMLEVSFDLGYVSRFAAFPKEPPVPNGYTMQGNGFKFGAGVAANVESIFLEMGLDYKLNGMFANAKIGKGDTELLKIQDMKHTIALEAKMDFFNFIKEGLNSGLVLSNETKIKSNSTTNVKDNKENSKVFNAGREIENEFAVGLHFAPVEFMDFTFTTKVASTSSKEYVNDPNNKDEFGKYVNKYSDPEDPKAEPYSTTAIGLGIGLEFNKGIFSFGIEYSPTLSLKENYQKDKDASTVTKTATSLPQEFKLTFGIDL